ncbi:MAG TPA: GNAT family N-acetyltransferase, partial [Catalimonadaceae bacterium]|nr:GNAT family N-acetyltransferase [Catalimonadaceae bacterium]
MNLYSPFPTFQTERLDIREFRDSDVDDYFRLRTEIDVMRYVNRPMPNRGDKMEQIRRVYQMHAEGTGIG